MLITILVIILLIMLLFIYCSLRLAAEADERVMKK